MIPHGLHHRYYANSLGTYGAMLQSGQFPRGHGTLGQGQGTICADAVGNAIPCTGEVMATLPALPGGGWIPSGQNVQTSPPPTATDQWLPVMTRAGTKLIEYLPYLAAAGFFLVLARGSRRGSSDSGGDRPRRRRR